MFARESGERIAVTSLRSFGRLANRSIGRESLRFWGSHSPPPRARRLPCAIICDGDADAPGGELRDLRTFAAREDASAGALGKPVDFDPLAKSENSIVLDCIAA
jgi:hypothetical protein